jgi:hypothetical protein
MTALKWYAFLAVADLFGLLVLTWLFILWVPACSILLVQPGKQLLYSAMIRHYGQSQE